MHGDKSFLSDEHVWTNAQVKLEVSNALHGHTMLQTVTTRVPSEANKTHQSYFFQLLLVEFRPSKRSLMDDALRTRQDELSAQLELHWLQL